MGYSPEGRKEPNMTEPSSFYLFRLNGVKCTWRLVKRMHSLSAGWLLLPQSGSGRRSRGRDVTASERFYLALVYLWS